MKLMEATQVSGFLSEFVSYNAEDEAYTLTSGGITFTTFLIYVAILFACIGIYGASRKKSKENDGEAFRLSTKQLVFSAVSLAIAFPLSYIKIIHMPWGGSVTLCSMFFVTLIGYWYGPAVGFSAAFAYSLLQFLQGGSSYMLSPLQVGLDYIFAFTALGASGFFRGKKHGMITGYLVAIMLRGLFHTIGGYLFWMDYMPDNFPASLSMIYPIAYNYAYILPEGIITVVILMLSPVSRALARISQETQAADEPKKTPESSEV